MAPASPLAPPVLAGLAAGAVGPGSAHVEKGGVARLRGNARIGRSCRARLAGCKD